MLRHPLTRRCLCILRFGLLGIATPVCMTAQQSSSSATLAANLATITTDTGAMAPGHREFSRYTRPELCLAAMIQVQSLARRSLDIRTYLDTVRDTRQDPVGLASVRTVGHACVARLSAAGVATDPQSLWIVALLMHDDTLAQVAYRRALAGETDSAAKAAGQVDALSELLGMGSLRLPMRETRSDGMYAAAQFVLADIDRTAPMAVRLQAHATLLRYWMDGDSLSAVQHAAEDILTLWRQAPAEVKASRQGKYTSDQAYRALMAIAFFASPDSMVNAMTAVAASAQHDSVQIRGMQSFAYVNAASLSAREVVDALSPIGMAWDPHQRAVFPRMTAEACPTGRDTVIPAPGKITLLVSMAASDGGRFSTIVRNLRRWVAQYGPRGFAVTIVEAIDDTVPYWYRGQSDWVLGPLTPAQRARQDDWFYRDYAQLPATVVEQHWRDQFESWPNDQRKRIVVTPFEQVFGKTRGAAEDGMAVLIDRDGTIVRTGNITEDWWGRLIRRIVTEK